MPIPKAQRLLLLASRLEHRPPASTLEEARTMLSETLNAIEDLHSGVPFNVPGRPDVVRFRSKDHNTFISRDGAIRIERVGTKRVIVDKAGRGGRRVFERELR